MEAMALPAGEIHLWALDYRRERGRAPLHAVLGGYLGHGVTTLQEEAYGRPRLAGSDAWLDFSWSHSGERACVAVAQRLPRLGVDIELSRPRPRAAELATRFFDGGEAEWVRQGAATARFLHLWTVKEAVLKAHGRGIGYGLERVVVETTAGAPRLLRVDGEAGPAQRWRLRAIDELPGFCGVLAWSGGAHEPLWRGEWPGSGT